MIWVIISLVFILIELSLSKKALQILLDDLNVRNMYPGLTKLSDNANKKVQHIVEQETNLACE